MKLIIYQHYPHSTEYKWFPTMRLKRILKNVLISIKALIDKILFAPIPSLVISYKGFNGVLLWQNNNNDKQISKAQSKYRQSTVLTSLH